ncbi:hypothetical protein C8Q80DRAFT_649031 [Daedaleopsis nitida]|nr:hypothetical protein C8Q80DRAFT_649031 [Daedaleopsis nitida]
MYSNCKPFASPRRRIFHPCSSGGPREAGLLRVFAISCQVPRLPSRGGCCFLIIATRTRHTTNRIPLRTHPISVVVARFGSWSSPLVVRACKWADDRFSCGGIYHAEPTVYPPRYNQSAMIISIYCSCSPSTSAVRSSDRSSFDHLTKLVWFVKRCSPLPLLCSMSSSRLTPASSQRVVDYRIRIRMHTGCMIAGYATSCGRTCFGSE